MSSLVKLWRKSVDALCLIFEDPHDMAEFFIIGLQNSQVTLTQSKEELHVVIHELSEDERKGLWGSPLSPPFPVQKLLEGLVGAADAGDCVEVGSTDRDWKDSNQDEIGGAGSSNVGGGAPPNNDLEGQGDDSAQVMQGRKEKFPNASLLNADGTLKITLFVRGMPSGHGVTSVRRDQIVLLPSHIDSDCTLSAVVEWTFSEIVQPQVEFQHLNEKVLDLSISSFFQLSDWKTLLPLEAGKGFRLGLLHDELKTSVACTSSADAFLIMNAQATDISSLNVHRKNVVSCSKSNSRGVQLGVNKIVTAQASTLWSSSATNSQEEDSALDLLTAKGTAFLMFDTSDQSHSFFRNDILSFTALHNPSLRGLDSPEAAGLPLKPSSRCVSALGRSTRISFDGKCLLGGRQHEDYEFKLERCLAEFNVSAESYYSGRKEKDTYSDDGIVLGSQKHIVNLIVNHGFSLSMHRGSRFFWRLTDMSESAPSPVPSVMSLRV